MSQEMLTFVSYNNKMSLSYKDIYRESLEDLKKNLQVARLEDENTYVVALSRKGPRLLEYLYGREIYQKVKIITEHALPFVFKSLRGDTVYRFIIFDDAIYFGSTMEGVYNSIISLKDYFNVQVDVKAYVAIHSVEAKKIDDLVILPDVNVPAGYGHYFVKRVMSDIRSRKAPIEVDFPRFTIQIKEEVASEQLMALLNKVYPERVYKVSHKECESLNVILPSVQGSFFNKLRIYLDGKELHIVPMTPRVINDNNDSIRQRFQYAQKGLSDFWSHFIANYTAELHSTDEKVRQPLVKSMITLANYIYSCNTFLQEYERLVTELRNTFLIVGEVSLDVVELSLLLGDIRLTKELSNLLENCLKEKTQFVEYGINLFKFSDKAVYDSYNYPTPEEKELLRNRDHAMVANSRNISQALSAIFFNQNILLERWSRRSIFNTSSRLNFGYTFHSLKKEIEEYLNKFSWKDHDNIILHTWVDERIEQGCIVPQYVCDVSNHIWTRVFRPGENEDVQLSHLTRWVVSVFNKITNQTGITEIPKSMLDEMLSYLIVRIPDLSDDLGIRLEVQRNTNEGQEGRRNAYFVDDEGQTVNLCSYMENMYILSYQNSNYTISKYLADNDIKLYTTLSSETIEQQDSIIEGVINDFKKYYVPYHLSFLIFNYYYSESFDLKDFSYRIITCSKALNDMLYQIEASFRGQAYDKPLLVVYNEMVKCFTKTFPYILSISLLYGPNREESLFTGNPSIASLERKVFLLSALVNIVHAVYCVKNVNLLKSYLNNPQEYYDYLEMTDAWSKLKPLIEENQSDQASKSRNLLLSIRSAIINSILN